MNTQALLEEVSQYYLNSDQFNGYPLSGIDLPQEEAKSILSDLIQQELISLNFGDRHPNPHIMALEPESTHEQLTKLAKFDLGHPMQSACVYPSRKHLEGVVDHSRYIGTPFTLQLALGEPQLKFLSFDLSVLEWYRNDPRYLYQNSDIGGSISIHDDYYFSTDVRESDKIVLQSFGFSYTDELKRAVAVFLRYLSALSPEHQQVWNAKLLSGDYWLHPEYARSSAGEWPESISIFDALIEELHHINEMSTQIGWPNLFKDDFKGRRHVRFAFIIRPTSREFQDFVHLLDKMLSDNVNREFFKYHGMELEFEEKRRDGRINVTQKGTILLLDEWLALAFNTPDRSPIDDMIAAFRKVRKLRQKPAHIINDDVFDQKYYSEQRELMIRAYKAVSTIRFIFSMHPRVQGYTVPKWLAEEGGIFTF